MLDSRVPREIATCTIKPPYMYRTFIIQHSTYKIIDDKANFFLQIGTSKLIHCACCYLSEQEISKQEPF